jgi:ADP-ribose pyrophosphatase YjhB (NUDIX family)
VYEAPVFCTQCAARLEEQAVGPAGKRVPVCGRCGAVHWIDPKIAAGILMVRGDRVLLVKRGIEPGLGRWTFPGGHVDRGETLEEAALRETLEECGVTADLGPLLGAFSYPGRPVVIVIYRGTLAVGSPEPHACDETLEVGWFTAEEAASLPLAFQSVADALEKLFGRVFTIPG